MYKLIISFIWSSQIGKSLVCGKGFLSGVFWGWKARIRFKQGVKDYKYHSGNMKLEEGKVLWIIEDESLAKLKFEEADFRKPIEKLGNKNTVENYENIGVLITFDYYKDGVKI
jgi:hypothetical protein